MTRKKRGRRREGRGKVESVLGKSHWTFPLPSHSLNPKCLSMCLFEISIRGALERGKEAQNKSDKRVRGLCCLIFLLGAGMIVAATYQTFTLFSVHYYFRNYYYPHFTDKETDSKEVKWFAQGYTAMCRYGTQTCPCCLRSWSYIPSLSAREGISQVPGYRQDYGESSLELVLPPSEKAENCGDKPPPSFSFLDPSSLSSLRETWRVCILPLAANHFCVSGIQRSDL